MSRSVSLGKVPMADEPVPDPIPQAAPAPVSTAVARKLINPKYALVATGNHISPTSSDQNSSNKNSQIPTGLKITKARPKYVTEEPPVHPALADLEKAYLIPYLPTWPEPDPPSDVIGFINIRDEKRANQVHLQRSERFEVSQAIRFSAPLAVQTKTEGPALKRDADAAEAAENPPGNTNTEASTPVSPTKKQPKQKTQPAQNSDPTDATDSSGPLLQPNAPSTQDTQEPDAQAPTSPLGVTADSEPTDNDQKTPEAKTAAPPVPKPRTLQLVIDPASSEQLGQPQVTLMKINSLESVDGFSEKKIQEELLQNRGHLNSKNDCRDSGSNDEGSQDSIKVICDLAANEDPSSTSTASEEEFFDCTDSRDPLANGVTTGSGHGHRQGDGVNMMARLSQSMLDLREPNQDSAALLRQSQQLRRKAHPSPHRHIGQVSAS